MRGGGSQLTQTHTGTLHTYSTGGAYTPAKHFVVTLTVGKIWFSSIWTHLRNTKSLYYKWPLHALKISPVRIKVCSSSVSLSSQDRQTSSLQVSIFSQQVSWHTSHILNKWVSDRGVEMRVWHLYDTQKQLSHFLSKAGRAAWKQRRSWSRVLLRETAGRQRQINIMT